jgi:hypothetical protein
MRESGPSFRLALGSHEAAAGGDSVPPPLGPACRGASATELQSQSGTEDALRAIVDDAVSLVLGTDGTKQNFSSILTPTDDRQHSQARESVSTTRASTGRRHPVRLTSRVADPPPAAAERPLQANCAALWTIAPAATPPMPHLDQTDA